MLQNNVIYVFVRRDLSSPQRVVQVGHCLIEVQKKFPYQGDHPYLIVMGMKSEKSLRNVLDFLQERGIMGVEFREPDRDNELTAVATQPLPKTEETKRIFKKFQLLKE